LRQAWQQLADQALVMFVSANAVLHFFAAQPSGATWPAGTLAGSTGPGTSGALLDAGVRQLDIVQPAAAAALDSESLWAELRSRDWRGRRALIVRGEGGRDWLAAQLAGAGARVDFLAAYRRRPPQLDDAARALLAAAKALPREHCWLFSSAEAVDHLRALASAADWSAADAIASHPRIADAARAAGFARVQVVDARLDAVLGALASLESAPS
jgi:uroporphyrinogen-III synthase